MSKKDRDFDKAERARDAQRAAAPGLQAAGIAGARAHIERTAKGANYAGKDFRAAGEDHKDPKSGRRHLKMKIARNGDAIEDVGDVVGHGSAVRMIDPKRGSRVSRQPS